jgi:integrase
MAWLYQRPGSAFWWIGWRVNGRQFLKSTRETDRHKAEAKLREHEFIAKAAFDGRLTEAFLEALTGKALSQLTLKSALEDWLNECKGSTSPGTLARYKSIADELSDYLKASAARPLLRDVGTDELRAFLTAKRAKASASTVNLTRRILSTFFLRAIRNRALRENPMLPVSMFKASKGEALSRRAFTVEEIKLLYEKASSDFWRYMVMAGYTTGLRLGDLVTLRWGAVDFGSKTIHLTTRKTERPMHIPMAAVLVSFLDQQRPKAGKISPAAFIWPEHAKAYLEHGAKVISNEFYAELLVPAGLASHRTHKKAKSGRAAARELGGVSFHSLRHSFVSMLKLTGASQSVAKELAGHSSDTVSDLYTHTPQHTLSEAVNKLPWQG